MPAGKHHTCEAGKNDSHPPDTPAGRTDLKTGSALACTAVLLSPIAEKMTWNSRKDDCREISMANTFQNMKDKISEEWNSFIEEVEADPAPWPELNSEENGFIIEPIPKDAYTEQLRQQSQEPLHMQSEARQQQIRKENAVMNQIRQQANARADQKSEQLEKEKQIHDQQAQDVLDEALAQSQGIRQRAIARETSENGQSADTKQQALDYADALEESALASNAGWKRDNEAIYQMRMQAVQNEKEQTIADASLRQNAESK